jgi:hypothetical protein
LPTKDLHKEDAEEIVDWSFPDGLMIICDLSARFRRKVKVTTRSGNPVLVTFHGHGSFVMGMMGGTPSIIGN